eukprot:736406-Prymnesium_polylepis.2
MLGSAPFSSSILENGCLTGPWVGLRSLEKGWRAARSAAKGILTRFAKKSHLRYTAVGLACPMGCAPTPCTTPTQSWSRTLLAESVTLHIVRGRSTIRRSVKQWPTRTLHEHCDL